MSPADERELKAIVRDLYASVSASAGVTPRGELERPHLHPEVRKVRTTHGEDGAPVFHVMTAAEHRESVERLVTEPGFFEVEVEHRAFVYGDIAHVLSHYEAYADAAGTELVKKGVNSIQLLRIDGRWRVFSMIWDDEVSRLPMG